MTKVHFSEPLSADDFQECDPSQLRSYVTARAGILDIRVPLRNIGSTQDPGDIAIDYVEALYFGQRLTGIADNISLSHGFDRHSASIIFHVKVRDIDAGCDLIFELMRGLFVAADDESLIEDVSDLEEQLFNQVPEHPLKFPELADDYMANLLHASDYWIEPGSKEKYHERFPETKFMYWRSFCSPRFGFELFVSPTAWVAPPSADVGVALSEKGFWVPNTKVTLHDARIIRVDGEPPLLVSATHALRAPLEVIDQAIHFSRCINPFGEATTENRGDWRLSSEGDAICYRTTIGQYITFGVPEPPDSPVLARYLESYEKEVHALREIVGTTIHTPCNWSRLDDETFEELCYDVVRRLPQFDSGTVRKMGKSRSRDGGRDITAMTKARPGHDPQKWIIQCKLIKSRRSLAAGNVNVSDTMDQFAAHGYFIITNALVDATLYDRLDEIGRRRNFQCTAWSGLEVERHLQRHRDLLLRYFSGGRS